MDLLVSETNRLKYFTWKTDQLGGRDNLPASARAKQSVDLTLPELKAFLTTLILMGLSPRGNYELYWSTSPMLEWPFLRQIMSRDRFMNILRFFHACDNSVRNDDKLYKVGSILSILLPARKKAYYPDREICLDESMIAFKGRAPGPVYQPKNHINWVCRLTC